MQRERKERITKREWYDRGGFANPALFRKQSRGGAWRYYVALDHHDNGREAAQFPGVQDMALSADDVQFIVSENGSRWAYDYRRTEEEAKALAAKLTDENGKIYLVEPVDDFNARRKAETLAEFTLTEITEDFYEQMLNCLPPMHREGAMGFFMCEMTSGSVTSQFVRYNGRYFGASVCIVDRETWITPEKINALAVAAPLTWFPKERGQ